jgi:hypothetical protein
MTTLSGAHAGCGGTDATYCSKGFYGRGTCNGIDQLPIFEQPWEHAPIEILAVSISLRADIPPGSGYVFAGNSFDPDIMAFQIGTGATTRTFMPGHAFVLPAAGPNAPHIDLHVSCTTPPPRPILFDFGRSFNPL